MWLNRILSSTRSDTGPLSQFYSWYIYPDNEAELGRSVSSAEFVDDVNEDSIVIVDGLTKVRTSFMPDYSDTDLRYLELASSWFPRLLGCWPQEPHHGPLTVRFLPRRRCQSPVRLVFLFELDYLLLT